MNLTIYEIQLTNAPFGKNADLVSETEYDCVSPTFSNTILSTTSFIGCDWFLESGVRYNVIESELNTNTGDISLIVQKAKTNVQFIEQYLNRFKSNNLD
jgi:hypothetical protein